MKTNLSLTKLIVFIVLSSSLASANPMPFKAHVAPPDCQPVAETAAWTQFLKDNAPANNQDDPNEYAHVGLIFVEDGDAPTTISVDIDSNNVYDWDGYARYTVEVSPNAHACQVVRVTLKEREG